MERPAIGVIITSFNRRHVLDRAIFSAVNQSHPPLEILVVDDGSDEPIRQHFARVVNLHRNVGAPRARNIGALLAHRRASHLFFMDDDCHLDRRCLELLASSEAWRDGVAATGGSVWETPPETRHRILTARPMHVSAAGTVVDLAGLQCDEERWYEADHLRGGNLLVSREAFYEAGMLDEGYCVDGRSFKDETDLCLRLRQLGHGLLFNPGAKARHYRERRGGVWERFGSDVHFDQDCEDRFHAKWRSVKYLSRSPPPEGRLYERVEG